MCMSTYKDVNYIYFLNLLRWIVYMIFFIGRN